ncbi:MAG: enoyl-CoA hydratase/isomerase family protein [Nanoarchaeota archaeon]|nr:enoyl-CoA hydratase/isomerase family protein [Nanoarchaeota archaeon]
MVTTIQITEDLQVELSKRKLFSKETYEEVIWNLIEDNMELSEEAKKDIEEAREEIRQGKAVTLEEAKKRLGI